MQVRQLSNNEVTILTRLLEPRKPSLSPPAARAILSIEFPPTDRDRMNELAAKARAGTLTLEEESEIEAYSRIGSMLSILKSKARKSLKSRSEPAPKLH